MINIFGAFVRHGPSDRSPALPVFHFAPFSPRARGRLARAPLTMSLSISVASTSAAQQLTMACIIDEAVDE